VEPEPKVEPPPDQSESEAMANVSALKEKMEEIGGK